MNADDEPEDGETEHVGESDIVFATAMDVVTIWLFCCDVCKLVFDGDTDITEVSGGDEDAVVPDNAESGGRPDGDVLDTEEVLLPSTLLPQLP